MYCMQIVQLNENNKKQMFMNIQPEILQKKIRIQVQNIRHEMRMLSHISQQIQSLSKSISHSQSQHLYEKSDKIKNQIRQKIKMISNNIDQMVQVIDNKIIVLCKQVGRRLENKSGNSQHNVSNINGTTRKPIFSHTKTQQEYKYQINQLEQRILQLQKKQNEYVKQISQLKEKHCRLREDFSNLSFDSNQRIKQLSQKLHNNTSPNLTINRIVSHGTPIFDHKKNHINDNNDSVIHSDENLSLKNRKSNSKGSKNNFVKIKGLYTDHESHIQNSPVDKKKNKNNILDSFTSQESEYDKLNFRTQLEQSNGGFKFGCFPTKHSEKTKTGSSSENKRLNLQQKSDKNRRFEFLLNNLIDTHDTHDTHDNHEIQNKNSIIQGNSAIKQYHQGSINTRNASNKAFGAGYQEQDDDKSVFSQNVVKRYQI